MGPGIISFTSISSSSALCFGEKFLFCFCTVFNSVFYRDIDSSPSISSQTSLTLSVTHWKHPVSICKATMIFTNLRQAFLRPGKCLSKGTITFQAGCSNSNLHNFAKPLVQNSLYAMWARERKVPIHRPFRCCFWMRLKWEGQSSGKFNRDGPAFLDFGWLIRAGYKGPWSNSV